MDARVVEEGIFLAWRKEVNQGVLPTAVIQKVPESNTFPIFKRTV